MLTVKLMKYGKPTYSGSTDGPSTRDPWYLVSMSLYPAESVFVEMADKHGRQVVSFQVPKTGDMQAVTIGDAERDDVEYNACYVMNDQGRTVETIR